MWRKVIASFVLVLAVAGCLFSVWRSPDYQDCKAEKTQQAATQKQEERDSRFMISVDCVGSFVRREHDSIIAVFTIILGIGTFLLWWATRDLVEGAERTAELQLRVCPERSCRIA